MALSRVRSQTLNFISSFRRPESARLVATGSNNLVALGIKRDFTDFILVALQNSRASTREDIVDARHSVGTRCCQLVARLVEARVENFVVVAAELLDALARADVPQARRSVDTSSQAVVTREIELPARELG